MDIKQQMEFHTQIHKCTKTHRGVNRGEPGLSCDEVELMQSKRIVCGTDKSFKDNQCFHKDIMRKERVTEESKDILLRRVSLIFLDLSGSF